jgi:hypothetical protein
MRLSRVVHEKTHLLDCIGEVRTSQPEILESSGEAAILSGICHWSAIHSRQLGMSVHRSRRRVTLSHAGALKQVGRHTVAGRGRVRRRNA